MSYHTYLIHWPHIHKTLSIKSFWFPVSNFYVTWYKCMWYHAMFLYWPYNPSKPPLSLVDPFIEPQQLPCPHQIPACHASSLPSGMVSSMQIDGMFISLGHRYASRNTRASISTRLNHAFNKHLMQAKMLWWCSVFSIDRMSIPRSLLPLSDPCIGLPQLLWPHQIPACHVSRLPVR